MIKHNVLTDAMASYVCSVWRDEVHSVRRELPDAVLVGGAIRDTYLGRPVKDRDFMTTRPLAGNLFNPGLCGNAMRSCLIQHHNSAYEGDSGCMICAYENSDKSVNVLLVSSILGRIQEFPDSLSQIWYDGERVFCTPEFSRTLETRVITYKPNMSEERLARIKSKYPDFKFEYLED